MYCPASHEIRSFPDSRRASVWTMQRRALRWQSRMVLVLLALLMVGCNTNYPMASEENVDVCALTQDLVTAALDEAPIITKQNEGVCLFHTPEASDAPGSIQISLLTRTDVGYAKGLDQVLRVTRAEAEAAYGSPGLSGFGDLPEDAVSIAFGMNPPDYVNQVVVTERGVLMEISISGEILLSHDKLAALTRELWMRVANYDPNEDATKAGEVDSP